MNFLHTLIVLSFSFNFTLSGSQLCRKRPNESSDAEAAEQRQRLRRDALHYCDRSFEEGLGDRYSNSQLRLLGQLKQRCNKSEWPEKRKLILYATDQGIHPDDILLELNGFPDREWCGSGQNRPLPIAVTMNDLGFAQKLLKRNSDPNQCSDNGSYSVIFNVSSPEMAQLLLAYRGDATCISPYSGETLLHSQALRCRRLSLPITLLFFNAGAKVDGKPFYSGNPSPLLSSLWGDRDDILLATLVKLGAPLEQEPTSNTGGNKKSYREIIEAVKEYLSRNQHENDTIPKCQASLEAIEHAKQEVEQARKEYNGRVGTILKQEIGIDRDSSSLIVAYAQEHVLPQSVQHELAENAARYPCEIDKLPNYNQEEPSFFWRLLGY